MPTKSYLHLLAFIKHQFYKRQDTLVDILLKSVTSIKHSANAKLADKEQATRKERKTKRCDYSMIHTSQPGSLLKALLPLLKRPKQRLVKSITKLKSWSMRLKRWMKQMRKNSLSSINIYLMKLETNLIMIC